MKNLKRTLAAVIVLVAFGSASNAQSTTQASATATIVTPILITKTGTDLNFGNIAVSGPAGGTVTVAPDGGRTKVGAGLTLPPTNLGTVSAAQFTVTGTAGYTYSVLVPTALTLTNTALAGGTMGLSNFTSSTSAIVSGAGTGTLDGTGNQALNIGATLTVGYPQAAGEYKNNSFDVTVNYN
jgi:hypothetical protein